MSEKIDFVKAAEGITVALKKRSKDLTEDGRIRYVYNEAIDDATNWVVAMGEKNPDIQLACMRLEVSMREWLPLRVTSAQPNQ